MFPADVWEDVMGYRCRDSCGLAAAAIAKVSSAMGRSESGDEDDELESGGEVEMAEFYSGKVTSGVCVCFWLDIRLSIALPKARE